MVIEYNERNSSAQQILNGLLSAGIIKIKKSASEKRIEELKKAILETEAMVADIRKNGTAGYKTLDELLAEA
ncbi:MAG: phosphatidate cytidylyltransferase [Dysgonamonadaceae bacterium]|nr:phosphatidate cytidylyltransferase [Dysgonamonadaceae bacterium]